MPYILNQHVRYEKNLQTNLLLLQWKYLEISMAKIPLTSNDSRDY